MLLLYADVAEVILLHAYGANDADACANTGFAACSKEALGQSHID